MTKNNAPIGVADSGIGGISVLKELVRLMPNENYLYFGDNKNAPYGVKTAEQVRKIMLKNRLIKYTKTRTGMSRWQAENGN